MPDASSDTDTTADLVDVRSEGRLIMNLDFHKRAIAKKEKRLLRAKRNLNQMQRKVWRLEKVVSKGNSSASDDSKKKKKKKKGMVLYSAISSPLDRSKRFTLSSPGRPVHSDTVLGFSWKHSSHAAIAQRLFNHISTTVYSQVLIYTAESTEAS